MKLKLLFFAFVVFVLALSAGSAQAQIDASSAVLFRSAGDAPEKEDLDSSRYQVRPKPVSEARALPSRPVPLASPSPSSSPAPSSSPLPEPSASPSPSPSPEKSESVSNQVKVFFLGGDHESIQEYRKMVHPADTRLNMVELSFAPTYSFMNSNSNFWPRNFSAAGSMADFAANIWVSPFFGLQTSYLTSLNGEIAADPTGLKSASYESNIFDVGFRFRNFFGLSRKSGSLSFGLDFEDAQTKIDSEARSRTGYRTSGVKIALDVVMPMSLSYATTMGVELAPNLTHHEDNADVSAGDGNKTTMIGASLGGKYLFDRKNQFFWKVSERLERNYFSGTVHAPDPASGLSPSGVVVNQSLTLIEIGFTWAP